MQVSELTGFQKQLIHQLSLSQPKSIVLPEGNDQRVIDAASVLVQLDVIERVVLIDDETEGPSSESLKKLVGDHARKIELVPVSDPVWRERASQHFTSYLKNKNRDLDSNKIATWASHPANIAGVMLADGHVHSSLAGCHFTTADVVRAALQGPGLTTGLKTLSSSFVMMKEEQSLLFGDCGVVIDPTPAQLADIAAATAKTAEKIFPDQTPRIAFLSFSTHGSAKHPAADKMREALEIYNKQGWPWIADGEIQFDAAFVPEIAERKCPDSPLKGQANCFIFPDLGAANIAYKVAQRLGGWDAYGPVLQGTSKPYSDLSRGASTGDIISSALILLATAN